MRLLFISLGALPKVLCGVSISSFHSPFHFVHILGLAFQTEAPLSLEGMKSADVFGFWFWFWFWLGRDELGWVGDAVPVATGSVGVVHFERNFSSATAIPADFEQKRFDLHCLSAHSAFPSTSLNNHMYELANDSPGKFPWDVRGDRFTRS